MTGTITEGAGLTQRQLNRAYLARQLLLGRSPMSARDALEHLVGLQSQAPNDPFVALWSRLEGFVPEELSRLMREREAVRGSLMRGTIHVVTTRDYRRLRPVLTAMHEKSVRGIDRVRKVGDVDMPAVLDAAREALRERPMTARELGEVLEARLDGVPGPAAVAIARFVLPLVQITPRGEWGASMQPTWAHIEDWTGAPVDEVIDIPAMIRRYLAAFGPATVADIQAWSGMTGLKAVVASMDDLVTFRNERGQVLHDLPGAPMPDPETPAPVRFLPVFDNALLSHRDRTRIISEERRAAIAANNGLFDATYLVDGVVAGRWLAEIAGETAFLRLRPFERHAPQVLDALEAEGRALLGLLAPQAEPRPPVVEPADT